MTGKNNDWYKCGGIATKGLPICLMLTTLVRLITTGFIVAGKNYGGYKYGGIAEKPSNLFRHN